MKILIGGSPCTHWSIAQTKNRETEASGVGWELFLNYRIARDKYQPDYFLYENNKSMSPAIRAQITAELGVEPVLINSALVSAQNRQRLYWVGKRNQDGTYSRVDVEQPEDRGVYLRDILETGLPLREKAYALLKGHSATAEDAIARRARNAAAEPITIKPLTEKEMDYMVRDSKGKYTDRWSYLQKPGQSDKALCLTANVSMGVPYNVCAEPVRIGTIENDSKNQDHDSQQYRVYSPDGKSVTLCGNGGGVGAKTGLYAVPCCMRYERSPEAKRLRKQYEAHEISHGYHEFSELHPRTDGKSNTLSTVLKDNPICEPVIEKDESGHYAISMADGKKYPVYEVRNGLITVKDKQYPIKLADDFYIIRKLTVRECMRLQTVPETYAFPVSDSQAYKMLGNGWTVEVIAHIMSHFTGLTEEPVEVLSMYDGMSCGHIALDKLGAKITAYYATEIDKYAVQTTQHNFPDTVQLGDAFQVRKEDWVL
jgi:DNA (cytosine-5)-methyltransferase 3A